MTFELQWKNKPTINELQQKVQYLQSNHSYSIKENSLICDDNFNYLCQMLKQGIELNCIYIDPPYNTKNKQSYQDSFKKGKDYHSEWLTFMYERLFVAHQLLKKNGVIFISIDENEFAHLKLLCDDIFGENNNLGTCIVQNNAGGRSDNAGFAICHEYLIAYRKTNQFILNNVKQEQDETLYTETDAISKYKIGGNLEKGGNESFIKDRPTMAYSIYYHQTNEKFLAVDEVIKVEDGFSIKQEADNVLLSQGYCRILPSIKNGQYKRWRWGVTTFNEKCQTELIVRRNKQDEYKVYVKDRITKDSVKQKTIFMDSAYLTSKGKKELEQDIHYKDNFTYPKPVAFIKHLLKLAYCDNFVVCDFFVGSGTTGVAVSELLKENMNITYYFCTNNENEQFDKITSLRVKKYLPNVNICKV